jgi:hypothetical protein
VISYGYCLQTADVGRPIQTYGSKGVAKDGVVKGHHAIAFTGADVSTPDQSEQPNEGEAGMLPPIRVEATWAERLSPKSRINFRAPYTVQHNVKVFEFGNVHTDYRRRLKENWKRMSSLDDSSDEGETEGQVQPQKQEKNSRRRKRG